MNLEQAAATRPEFESDLGSDLDHAKIDLSRAPSRSEALAAVPEEYAIRHDLIPLEIVDEVLIVACATPYDDQLLNEIQVMSRHRVRALEAPASEIQDAIRQRYRTLSDVDKHVQAFADRVGSRLTVPVTRALELAALSPVVEIVDRIIGQGLRDRASDIHIEPQQGRLRIRFRIDGLLSDALSLPQEMGSSICSRIKVMANMDIVDRHRAQDGQIRLENAGRQVDIRVSTTETIWGEKAVLRLLDQGRTVLTLAELGIGDRDLDRLARLLRSPYGMIVVSGPTGSGKTTTLYGALNDLDPMSQNITTIEDPVEYTFENINQIQIKRVSNVTFANGLKSILRQDPDVILVGEIRDLETAEIAIQSALTGHLVLSSLHATDAAGVIQRFIEMGIEGFLISSALIGVAAQRLVRRICSACPEEYAPNEAELELWREFGDAERRLFFRGRGCTHCAGTGFRGRVGVFEILPLSEDMKRLVSAKAPAQSLRELAIAEGMVPLRHNAVRKVAEGVTTLAEVMRCVWLV